MAVQSAAPAAQTLKTYFQVGIQVPLKARLQRHLLSGCGVTALNAAASSSDLLNIISLRFRASACSRSFHFESMLGKCYRPRECAGGFINWI